MAEQVQRGRALLHDNYATPQLGAEEMCARAAGRPARVHALGRRGPHVLTAARVAGSCSAGRLSRCWRQCTNAATLSGAAPGGRRTARSARHTRRTAPRALARSPWDGRTHAPGPMTSACERGVFSGGVRLMPKLFILGCTRRALAGCRAQRHWCGRALTHAQPWLTPAQTVCEPRH